MKTDKVTARDFLAHVAVEVETPAQVVVVTGPNAVGKSSLLDAVRWALSGRARGMGAKDVRSLVRRGAKSCSVDLVGTVAPGRQVSVHRTPSGSTPAQAHVLGTLGVHEDVLTAALDADTFVDEKPYNRRVLAMRATGARLSEPTLTAAGVTDPDVVRATLERGTEAGLRLATERRRAAQREAEAARVTAPVDRVLADLRGQPMLSTVDLAAVRKALDGIQADADALRTAQARHQQAVVARQRAQAAYEAAVKAAGGWDAATLRQQADSHLVGVQAPAAVAVRQAADALTAARGQETLAAGTVMRCQGTVKEASGSLWGQVRSVARTLATVAPKAMADLEALADRAGVASPEAAAKALAAAQDAHSKAQAATRQAQAAVDALAAQADAHRAAQAQADALRQRADALDAAQAAVDAQALPDVPADAQARLDALAARAVAGRRVLEEAAAYRAAAQAHQAGEQRAQAALDRAGQYAAMEEALKPDGAVASSLVDPRARLADVAAAVARDMGVPDVTLTDEWEVLVGGEDRRLLSASEGWRVRAAFAIALAALSGLRFVLLDEASICVGQARSALLRALVNARAHYDQVWLASSRGEAEPPVTLPKALEGVVQVVTLARGAAWARPTC